MPQQSKTPREKKPPKNAYETPTAEKIAFGRRLRHAREIAGMSLTEAAPKFGYVQPVQLSYMENGSRMATLRVLRQATELYGTTMDYLCGFADDTDRDPANAALRHITARVSADVQRLVNTMAKTSVEVVRELMPSSAQGQRVAALAIEANMAMARFVQHNKRFEDMRGGAELLRKVQAAAEAGVTYTAQVERAKRLMQMSATQAMMTAAESRAPQQISLVPMLDMSVSGG